MSVRYGFTIEIYGFMHSLRTSLARATHDAIAVKVEDLRIEDDARTSQRHRRRLTAQQEDERRQDNSRLACQHPTSLADL